MVRIIDTDYILKNVSPAEVIERYTGAKKIHNKYICPFHNDKHPSLSVKTNMWRCWSCGEGGNVINFTRLYFGLDFISACRKLSDDFNLNLAIDRPKKTTVWDEVAAESREWLKMQQQDQIRRIENEIQAYTIAHRVLYQKKYPAEITDKLSQKLDELELELQFWR